MSKTKNQIKSKIMQQMFGGKHIAYENPDANDGGSELFIVDDYVYCLPDADYIARLEKSGKWTKQVTIENQPIYYNDKATAEEITEITGGKHVAFDEKESGNNVAFETPENEKPEGINVMAKTAKTPKAPKAPKAPRVQKVTAELDAVAKKYGTRMGSKRHEFLCLLVEAGSEGVTEKQIGKKIYEIGRAHV